MLTEPGSSPLLAYAEMVWRRRLLVLIVAVGMAGAAYVVSILQQPMYESSAELLLSQLEVDGNLNITSGELDEREMNTQEAILTGTEVTERAAQLGATSEIATGVETNSNIISMITRDPDPAQAAETLNAYARAYSEYRLQRTRDTIEGAASQLELRVNLLQEQIDSPATVEADILQARQAALQEKLSQFDIQLGLADSNVMLVQRPTVPSSPTSPNPVRDAIFALLLGLVLGISLAVLLENLSRRPARSATEPPASTSSTSTSPLIATASGEQPGQSNQSAPGRTYGPVPPSPVNHGRAVADHQ